MSIPIMPGAPDLPASPEVPALPERPVGSGLCPTCGAPLPDGARFCEVCGAPRDQAPPWRPFTGAEPSTRDGTPRQEAAGAGSAGGDSPPCRACGGTVAADGSCETCGARGVSERDHVEEQPAPWLAGTCDRGIRHQRNEDAMALAVLADGAGALVVCDGVSSSTDPDVASLAAATAARDSLAAPCAHLGNDPGGNPGGNPADNLGNSPGNSSGNKPSRGPDGDEPEPGEAADAAGALATRLRESVAVAQQAVVAATRDHRSPSPPSCTIVAAVLAPAVAGGLDPAAGSRLLAVAWIGDSRAYWLPDDGGASQPSVLTLDDSVAAEQMALGMSREDAERGPHAHAITRWLGVDSPVGPAHTVTAVLRGPGWLLVCSDGLWNYCSESADLAVLLAERSALLGDGAAEPLALSRALVDWANERGGHDNITVALARIDGPADMSRGSAQGG